jgi:hypothetical protein
MGIYKISIPQLINEVRDIVVLLCQAWHWNYIIFLATDILVMTSQLNGLHYIIMEDMT